MNILKLTGTALAVAMLTIAGSANAAIVFDQNVTPEVIFGDGNANGSFTVEQANGVELGLRAKVRFNALNSPENTFNSNGDGTYSFKAGLPPTGFSFAPNSPSTATWNFEWTINSDFDGNGVNLDQLTYEIMIDFDPGVGTNFLIFDPINQANQDHAIGTNATGNGDGTSSRPDYAALIAANNVAQNSWNMEFFDSVAFPFAGGATGIYNFVLTASDETGVLASTEMQVIVTPEPATLTLFGLGLLGLGVARRRQKRAA